ncbi:hypothetical protein KBD75_00135 [Candidatus Woesebacteria bacterium]|nr:hypothetical protein [Candidatus Woesebacteria bacterium]
MVNENKSNVFAAVAGVVVGAGAVIAGAVALADKKNQDKVKEVLSKGKEVVKDYVKTANKQVDKGRNVAKAVASKAVKTAEKATKAAKQEVRKI